CDFGYIAPPICGNVGKLCITVFLPCKWDKNGCIVSHSCAVEPQVRSATSASPCIPDRAIHPTENMWIGLRRNGYSRLSTYVNDSSVSSNNRLLRTLPVVAFSRSKTLHRHVLQSSTFHMHSYIYRKSKLKMPLLKVRTVEEFSA